MDFNAWACEWGNVADLIVPVASASDMTVYVCQDMWRPDMPDAPDILLLAILNTFNKVLYCNSIYMEVTVYLLY